ncbi:Vps51/Vps67-domain-containing protein [Lophiotrema nucula]|uniref:Vacuolar protein sorting-associated protein 51 homolog n=1 Tax=Lophiotrema nucula TaxID=690887 RepID=A0A6A5ZT91_9PLEO|nr:Vps51/Vps67-domain-containing protein [Lophiotrema nucula]
MSTIASPRVSTSIRSPSSTRTSFDSTARPTNPNPRRNRAALREFYGLKAANKEAEGKISEESTRTDLGPEEDETSFPELDKEGFDAETFVEHVLATSGLSGVLKVEADLVSQIRNLDSDRKSLVYDNYSKLLAATSTIRRMRTNMDPLAPTTHTLSPAISHIAETAASLSSSMQVLPEKPKGLGIDVRVSDDSNDEVARKKREKDTVRWVLDTPRRLHALIDQEQDEQANDEWEEVSKLLDKWQNVPGVKELRQECEEIMQDDESE